MMKMTRSGVFKMKIKTVLFDLDGTLTDSGPGIINGVQYALKKYGMEVDDLSRLRCFIGPPLHKQFEEFCGFSEEEGKRAVAYYREYYSVTGLFENEVYEGIPELLQTLRKAGIQTAMATSKPEKYALMIADHFNLTKYFDFIGGSMMDGNRTKKAEVIEYVLEACGVEDRDTVLMVGDREHDIIGAKEAGVHSAGVLYGYGTLEELEKVDAGCIIKTPAELLDVIG